MGSGSHGTDDSDGVDDVDDGDPAGDEHTRVRATGSGPTKSGPTKPDGATEAAPFVWETPLGDETGGSGDADDVTGAVEGDEPDARLGPDQRLEADQSATAWDADSTRRRTLDPERYLFAGETIAERVDVRRGWVVATSHRLLVFDPDSSETRFVTVDRPNVDDVRLSDGSSRRVRSYALRAGLYAVVLLAGGSVARGLGLQSLFTASTDVGTTPGVDGLVSALSLVGALVGLFVDLVFFSGIAAGLIALVLGVWYVRGRQPTLVVERAGEEDIGLALPSNAVGRRIVDGLEQAFREELALGRE